MGKHGKDSYLSSIEDSDRSPMEAISKLHRRGSELHRLICKDSVIFRSSDLNSDPSITRISSSDLEKISVRFLRDTIENRVLSNKEEESSLSEAKWLEHDESLAVWVKTPAGFSSSYWHCSVYIKCLSLFRFVAVGRKLVVVCTLGTCTLIMNILLGGFIVAQNDIEPFMIWGYYISPGMYGQNALVINEFLDKRWSAGYYGVPRLFNYGIGIHLLQSEDPKNMPKICQINPKDNHISFQGGKISNMVKNEDSGSPSWSASLFMQTIEDVARAVAAAAAAATTVRSPRPYVVFSSKDDNGNSPLHKLQHQVSRVLKGFSQPPEVKSGTYNPEVLTSQKRLWASVQLQSLLAYFEWKAYKKLCNLSSNLLITSNAFDSCDHRPLKEPSRLFESMVVVGLHPNCDIQALQKQYFWRKSEGSGKFRSALSGQHQSRVEPNLEPQVLLKYKDLLSFCFPGGVEVHAIEKTSSMNQLNEILLG
ncbi:unnamed protein product [Camellia sinensis]